MTAKSRARWRIKFYHAFALRHYHAVGVQHSAGWLRHRPDQRGGVMGLFRHGPARPGHLLRHVLMGMARTSRAMTPKARRRSVSINLRSALADGWRQERNWPTS